MKTYNGKLRKRLIYALCAVALLVALLAVLLYVLTVNEPDLSPDAQGALTALLIILPVLTAAFTASAIVLRKYGAKLAPRAETALKSSVYALAALTLGVAATLMIFLSMLAGGALSIGGDKLVFASSDARFVYDGEAHSGGEWALRSGELQQGHTAEVAVTGSAVEAGEFANTLTVKITDEGGADVTDFYDIEYRLGTISVEPRPITVQTGSAGKRYDGTPLTDGSWQIVSLTGLVAGHGMRVGVSGSRTEVGESANTVSEVIISDGERNVTSNYDVTVQEGTLTVYENNPSGAVSGTLSIRPVSEYYLYDGTRHAHSGALQGLASLTAQGFRYEAEVSGSRTTAGKAQCVIRSFRLFDANGSDVTRNFDIQYGSGTLQVYLTEITVTTSSDSKVYDGTALTCADVSLSGVIFNGHSVSRLVADGARTEAGISVNTFSLTITDGSGADVTDVYKINAVYGSLEIIRREISVTASSAQKVYDGSALESAEYSIDGELAAGHTEEAVVSGSQTEAGRSANRVSEFKIYDADGRDVTDNYAVDFIDGVLRVTAE